MPLSEAPEPQDESGAERRRENERLRGHALLPAGLARSIPPLYATEKVRDPVAHVKFFTPDSSWSFFVLEYDPQQRLGFGLVLGHERELGYFSLDELEEIRGPGGLPIERDLHFTPVPLSRCR
jgi:Protein of unknown function (DUF2958)